MRGMLKVIRKPHFHFTIGYNTESIKLAVIVGIAKSEVCFNLELFYFGIYIGWLS